MDRRVFDTAFALWSSRAKIIDTRRRLKRYTYGDQWGDVYTMPDGERVSESVWMSRQGRRPLTNNLIRRLVKAIVGRYREMPATKDRYDNADNPVAASLLLEELDSRLLEEFLISGMAIQRVADDNPFDSPLSDVTNVCPDQFFCNDFRDPRGSDIEIVGMLHDMSPAEVLTRFGGTPNSCRNRRVRRFLRGEDVSAPTHTSASAEFYTARPGRLRVIEVWTREFNSRGNVAWRVRWFTHAGDMLDTYLSPWSHGSHPFAVKFYPLTDGEIHSFVEDLIDQQRYINRIIVLIDKILSTTAKGVLLFPQRQKVDNMSWNDVAKLWAQPDSIIPIRDGDSGAPFQAGGNNADMSAYRLLEMELGMFDRTSGVGASLLGDAATGPSSSGAAHYQAQVENSAIALADIFRTFRSFTNLRDIKLNHIHPPQPPIRHENQA